MTGTDLQPLKPRLVLDVEGYSLTIKRFYELALLHGLTNIEQRNWVASVSAELPDDGTEFTMRIQDGRGCEGIRVLDDGIVAFTYDAADEFVDVWTAASTSTNGKRLRMQARRWFPHKPAPPETMTAPFRFWSMGRYGAQSRVRRQDVCAWEAIEENYTAAARAALSRLHALDTAPDGGRLIVLHGEPGTGKTHLIRSLAWAWRRWCSFGCVLDPETLLGSSPAYLLDVLGHEEGDSRWTALVLEDTGELLRPDAGDRTGQGLARFLNMLDGLLGQGSRTLAIVTTNEQLDGLHPAVVRPGRCAARVEVGALRADEAAAWLAARGVDARPGPTPVAELFRMTREDVQLSAVSEPVRVGFV